MTDILHRVGIQAPAAAVYRALSTTDGVAGWWSRETRGDSTPGGTVHVDFRALTGELLGSMAMEVTALEPDLAVRWRCAAGPDEWIGTELEFTLSCADGFTIVQFAHRHWREATDFTAHCSTKWATFLLSLKALLETGEGQPAPHDLKIDNWN